MRLATYCECAQLSSSTLAPNSVDLRRLAGNSQRARSSLQIRHSLRIDKGLIKEQRVDASSNDRDKSSGRSGLAGEVQNQNANSNILNGDEGRLAIGAERELVAHAVGERDEETGGFKGVGHEGDAGRRARVNQFQDLGDLYHGAGTNDGQTERLGDGERCAGRILGDVEIEQEGAVAGRADQRDDRIVDGFGDGLDDGLQVWLERIQHCLLDGVHVGLWKWELRRTSCVDSVDTSTR